MRKQKQIIIDIAPDGNCSIDGEGFVGTECGHFLDEVESAIGTTTHRENKKEYSQRRITSHKNIQRTGR